MSESAAFADQVERIRNTLVTVTPAPREELANKANAAAVLMPLFERDGELHVIYIRRSDHVASHRGQVAVPGGRVEARDVTLLDAALREAHEEVGLDPASVDVVGGLPTMHTTASGIIIVAPFVGVIPPDAVLKPDPSEVAEVFDVPLSALRDPGYRGDYEFTPDGRAHASKFPAILYRGQVIWGLTLRITNNLLEILDGKKS